MPLSDQPLPAGRPLADPHQALLELRARAEKRRLLLTQATNPRTPEETQRLVQELQVHQIELEMQYEELLLAQAEAQDARAEYVHLYDFAPLGYLSLSETGQILRLNLCAAQLLGTVRQRLVGRRLALFVAPAQRLEFGQFLARVFQSTATHSLEVDLLREDGIPFVGQLEGVRVDLPAGPQCRLAVQDVTTRRRAQDALAASEARFRKLFTDSHDAVVLLQHEHYVDCNAAALRLLGLQQPAELVGQPASRFVPELQPGGQPSRELLEQCVAAALRQGAVRCEALMRRATGEEIWVEALLTPIEPEAPAPLVHVLWRDITAARAAAEALRQSQERLELALNATEIGVWAWEFANHQLLWDARAQRIYGLSYHAEPVSFEVLRHAIHPDDMVAVAAGLKQAVAAGTSFDLEYRIVWPNGQVRYVAAMGKAVYDEHQRPVRFTGIMRDATPRREAEIALRRQKEFTESLLENSVDGIIALDRDTRLTAWNAEAARYFGQEAGQVLGRPVFEVLPDLDAQARHNVALALGGEHVVRTGRPFTTRPGHYDVFMVPLKDDGLDEPTGVLIIVRDVTERNRLAEEATQLRLRRQQEVLAAVLATQESERKRIAEALHNGLGQLLYAAKLSLEKQSRGAAGPSRPTLRLLDEAIRTTRTLSFELTPGVLEDFGLRVSLEELVKRIAPAGLAVGLHLRNLDQRAAPNVEITVYRVVQELLNNVMKHAGATAVEVHVAREQGTLVVSVEDNGRGFDPALLAAEPLTGIGLAGARNRVGLLGGELTVASRPGQGTIVSFELKG